MLSLNWILYNEDVLKVYFMPDNLQSREEPTVSQQQFLGSWSLPLPLNMNDFKKSLVFSSLIGKDRIFGRSCLRPLSESGIKEDGPEYITKEASLQWNWGYSTV